MPDIEISLSFSDLVLAVMLGGVVAALVIWISHIQESVEVMRRKVDRLGQPYPYCDTCGALLHNKLVVEVIYRNSYARLMPKTVYFCRTHAPPYTEADYNSVGDPVYFRKEPSRLVTVSLDEVKKHLDGLRRPS